MALSSMRIRDGMEYGLEAAAGELGWSYWFRLRMEANGWISEFRFVDGSYTPVGTRFLRGGWRLLMIIRRAVMTRAPIPISLALLATASTGYYVREFVDRHP